MGFMSDVMDDYSFRGWFLGITLIFFCCFTINFEWERLGVKYGVLDNSFYF